MRRYAVIGALLAAGGLAAPGSWTSAQEPGVIHMERGPDRLMRIMLNRRARLGIKVNLQVRGSDSIGAYVDAVTPGGPAAQAGLRSGDLITRLNGKSVLAGGSAEGDQHRHESLPGLRLIELAARLGPGDTVAVEYRRGKERRTASVVTADEPELGVEGAAAGRRFGFRFLGPEAPGAGPLPAGDFLERVELPNPHWEFLSGSPLGRLELAPLNPDLGKYFGTADGVLVISAPKDSALGLRGGDVVLKVDGRAPSSPSHLLRILRSYETGETFKLDIMRNRKRESITARIAERDA